ncbi:MAG: alpha/beta fold hydrolase [Spirochaetia bacterium]|nr:alpha/beta fold hydrolase [Spirochaetia bacterium]
MRAVFPSGHFQPSTGLKAPWLQTFLAAAPFGYNRRHALMKPMDLELSANGVKLHAALSQSQGRGLVILIHGWEGHINAPYMIRTGQALYDAGYHVARLHLRDHGHTHHMNEGLFNGSMLDEHFEAVRQIAGKFPGLPAYLGGYSLGGNFALRIAAMISARDSKTRFPNLAGVFAISAPLDPYKSTAAMDEHKLLGLHLRKQWWRSLDKKDRLFPGYFRFKELRGEKSILRLTERLLQTHSDFQTLEDYFETYTLTDSFFKTIKVPAYLLTAIDDPIIPPEEYHRIKTRPGLEIEFTDHGGHVGFLNNLKFQCYYVERILQFIESLGDVTVSKKPQSVRRNKRGRQTKGSAKSRGNSKESVKRSIRKVRK